MKLTSKQRKVNKTISMYIDHEEPKHSTINFIQTDNEDEDINI